MKVLVTGFDPFGGEPINPAWEAVKAMKDTIAGAEIVKMQIPTVVGKSIEKIHQKMKELQPDLVISVGQAGGRFGVTPERVAINVTDARIPDNAGTYICNHVMYGILYYIEKEFPNVRGGFIHVPYAPSQVVNKPSTPSMALADITASLEAAVAAAISSKEDIRAVGGEIH